MEEDWSAADHFILQEFSKTKENTLQFELKCRYCVFTLWGRIPGQNYLLEHSFLDPYIFAQSQNDFSITLKETSYPQLGSECGAKYIGTNFAPGYDALCRAYSDPVQTGSSSIKGMGWVKGRQKIEQTTDRVSEQSANNHVE